MPQTNAEAHPGTLIDRLRPAGGGPWGPPKGYARAILVLPLIAVLPILLFAIVAFSYLTGERQRALEGNIVNVARHAIQAGDLLLQERLSTLQALASLVTDRDLGAFSRQATLLLSSRPDWVSITIRDAEGRLLASETRPGGPAPEGSAHGASEQGAGPAASVGRSAGQPPHLLVRMPVEQAGQERFFVSARLDLEPFSRVLGALAGPNWTLALLDPRGTIAGRSRDPSVFGREATPSLQAEMEAGGERFFYALNREGNRVYTRERGPDVVLMDINLAGPMDGIAAASAIRSCHDARIIFMTAYSMEDLSARIAELDAAVLHKPFAPDRLDRLLSSQARAVDADAPDARSRDCRDAGTSPEATTDGLHAAACRLPSISGGMVAERRYDLELVAEGGCLTTQQFI